MTDQVTVPRELLRDALYVIDAWERDCDHSLYWRDRDDAMKALRAALEQPGQPTPAAFFASIKRTESGLIHKATTQKKAEALHTAYAKVKWTKGGRMEKSSRALWLEAVEALDIAESRAKQIMKEFPRLTTDPPDQPHSG